MTSEKRPHKFHTDDVRYPDLGSASDWLKQISLAARARLAKEVLPSLCHRFNVPSLHSDQSHALHNFLCGRDVYVNKLTGSGKSIVICPLTSLMKDQVKQLRVNNISAAYISSDQSEVVLKESKKGITIYCTCRRSLLLNNDRWGRMLASKLYSSSLIGITVDEVHWCIVLLSGVSPIAIETEQRFVSGTVV